VAGVVASFFAASDNAEVDGRVAIRPPARMTAAIVLSMGDLPMG
jgi:hypothetical protein